MHSPTTLLRGSIKFFAIIMFAVPNIIRFPLKLKLKI